VTDPLADLAGTPLATLPAPVDNALTTGSDMSNANLAFELLCERLGVDRDALVHDRGWSTRHLPPDPGGPAGFACPICGAHDAEPTVTMEVDRDVTTTACEHTFKTSEWTFAHYRHEASGREWVTATPKTDTPEPAKES
jgi:hypothetical protein